jgi:hypothetical protein
MKRVAGNRVSRWTTGGVGGSTVGQLPYLWPHTISLYISPDEQFFQFRQRTTFWESGVSHIRRLAKVGYRITSGHIWAVATVSIRSKSTLEWCTSVMWARSGERQRI